MDKLKFNAARDKILNSPTKNTGIGTLGEKTLHAVLKEYFEPIEENQEVKIGKYVADIAGENGIIEIQTRNLYKLRQKLNVFLEYSNVTVVYPIAVKKYVRWLDLQTGQISERRKSPKKLTAFDSLAELYALREFVKNPKFSVCLCLYEGEDIRLLNGSSQNKKRGSTRYDRIPQEITDEIWLETPHDYKIFTQILPDEEFTVKDFSLYTKIPQKKACAAINLLTSVGVVEKSGKRGRFVTYVKN